MGGNLKIGNIAADKLQISEMNTKDVDDLKTRIKNGLVEFFNNMSNFNLFWMDYTKLIQNNEVFSGSSKHFFTKAVKEFSKVKKAIGDIDIQFPNTYENELIEYIERSSGLTFGELKLVGLGGRSPIQTNTLFTDIPTGLNVQIDFEPIDFKNKVPSQFAKFSHSSDWNDLEESIKGVFHKFMIRALVARERISNIYLVTSYNPKTFKWRVSKKEVEGTNIQGFSVDKGVRIKYERARNRHGAEFFVSENGDEFPSKENGTKPAYIETDTKTYDYIKDISKIATICFGVELNASELDKFGSFVGCLELINKYIPNDTDYIEEEFFNHLFGKSAQEIEQGEFVDGINENDFYTKFRAYKKLMKELFGIDVNDLNEIEPVRLSIIKQFYKNLESKKNGTDKT